MVSALAVSHDDIRLRRLLQLYLHEWSSCVPLMISRDATYPYPALDAWRGDDHDAVLFVRGDQPIGFALASRDSTRIWHVDEFFIVLGERRRGVGRRALSALMQRRAARWTLTVRPENPGGLAFWKGTLGLEPVPETGDDGIVRQRFTFESR